MGGAHGRVPRAAYGAALVGLRPHVLSSKGRRPARIARGGSMPFLTMTFDHTSRPATVAVAAGLVCLIVQAHAQAQAPKDAAISDPSRPTAATAPAASTSTLAPVVVTGNPLREGAGSLPASQIDAQAIRRGGGGSLGAVLDGTPGVAATGFGPNASRPVIRGQDGDRIRLLANGGASLDASALSVDHAVPIDPLAIERIEVVRGPAALMYGGSALGGVVNTLDNRIAREAVGSPQGAVELRLGGAADERYAGMRLEAGGDEATGRGLVLHADAFGRKTDDLRVPGFDRPVEGGSERRHHVRNSAAEAWGGALGASWVWESGHLGAAVDSYRHDYGVVVEDDVGIEMRRDQLSIDGEQRLQQGPWRTVRAQARFADYQHEEIEGGGEVGTRFSNRGSDARLELEHAPLPSSLGEFRGVVGLQLERSRFSALGEEAFVPATRTRQQALFVHESLAWAGEGARRPSLSIGLRLERTEVEALSDGGGEASAFGQARERRFDAGSLALGAALPLADPDWTLKANLARSQRAPTFYELYADGVHIATAAYERGDDALGKETGTQLDLGAEWRRGPHHLAVSVYASRYARYIAMLRSDEADVITDEGEALPVYQFSGVPARLHGLEAEGTWRMLDSAMALDLEAALDMVRGERRDTGEPLPRLAPWRSTLAIVASQGDWHGSLRWRHAARQDRVAADDRPTPSYDIIGMSLDRRVDLARWFGASMAGTSAWLYLRLDNLTDERAYNASSISTVRWLSPLPGRSVSAGARVSF